MDSESLPHNLDHLTDEQKAALELFGLTLPLTQATLDERYRYLLATWYPPRYAGLTNNPRKYMHMYKKGEAMTKAIHAGYALLRRLTDTGCTDSAQAHE
ncbi:MAG: hypothetical protein D6704_04800 [Nitrospirae bacterium]|nr:MAG: hypothetical protein D6704_04800 [Nitrospirota bacterium]